MRAPSRPSAALRWMRSHKSTTASIAIATAAATALSIMAFTYEGFTTTDVDLHDGGVWVTKTETSQLGRLNVLAQELDGGLTPQSTDFDVLQDDERVLFLDRDAGAIQLVDEVGMVLGPAVAVQGMEVAYGGGVVALLDSATGDLFAYPVDALATYTAEAEPLAELGEGAAVTVADDGSVMAASTHDATVTTWSATDGVLGDAETIDRQELDGADDVSIAALGDEAVVLDGGHDRLLLPDAVTDVPDGSVLQHSGPASDRVVLTTGELLVVRPMDGSNGAEQSFGSGSGDAVAPMQENGCIYAVWPGAGHFERDCAGEGNDASEAIEDLGDGPLTFRERHGIVVLNQIAGGNAWIVNDRVVLVNNWEALLPETSDETTESDDESIDEEVVNQPPPQSEENADPVANDDDFGARPGRATVLPVLLNDTDPDGDVLTVSVSDDVELPSGVRVTPIANDSRLQLELPEGYDGGGFAFAYRVDDGLGGDDTATVTVSISGPDENSPPEQVLTSASFQVEQTQDVEYQVLQDWVDPDGDDMFLVGAEPGSDDTAQASPGGTLRYTATGDTGFVDVQIEVSDGREDGLGEGSIEVEVTERGEATPIANTDFVSTTPGTEVTVQPLANDYVAGSDDARLAAVNSESSGLDVEWDESEGTVTILDGPVGEHYLTYQLAVGPVPVTGRIRVDIREPEDEAAPVAVRDVGLLPQGHETLIDLLENDVDPAGGVLVVQSVDVRADAPVTWQLLEHSILRITDNELTEPLELEYTISNGSLTDTGTVIVLPVEPPARPTPPVAVDDTWELREGDYTSIPVTDNDFSSDGLDFEVEDVLVSSSLDEIEEDDEVADGSVAFVDGDVVRLYVPVGGPSRVTLTYEITDTSGQSATATVTVDVNERDPDDNDPPAPVVVTSRVLAGSDVRIPIPLDGIDPDGDGVTLLRYDTGPEYGSIQDTGEGYFDFHADEGAEGTVEFTYRVRDRMGAEATALVVIGIAQPGDVNQPPQAATDRITVQPGRAIAYDVLQNDADPDGDSIAVSAAESDEVEGVEAAEDGETVDFVAPDEPGQYYIQYTVRDARGATATGTLFVTVDENADALPPRALDDAVPVEEAVAGQPVVVDVLDNDQDPDGDPSVLDLSVVEGDADVAAGGVQVTPVEDDFQIITYKVTDADGLTAQAFIVVPAADVRPPWLVDDEVEIPSGQLQELDLADYVQTSNGNAPRITREDRVSATWDSGVDLVVDEHTLQYESESGYRGDAAITFEVTDGESADDEHGLVSVLTINIVVTESSEVEPSFNAPSLTVAQGEDAPAFDLRDATVDPDPGDVEEMDYELADDGAIPGVSASIDDGMLTLEAGFDAVPGDTGTMTLRITDPAGNQIEGTVLVEVVVSTLPPAEVADHAEDGVVDEALPVAVLAGAFDPFASQGGSLTVVDATVLTSDGSSVTHDDETVTITPAQPGQLQVRYTVRDRTDTAAREVTGIITVTVRDEPEQPVRPNVVSVGNGQVTLRWVAPYDNGSQITGYLVESSDGTVSQECPSTTCTIENLQNGQTYQFTVTAINDIGESEPSPLSAGATPDTAPEQPDAPEVERGDEEVTVAWTPPANEGSAIQEYTVEISPAPASGPTQQTVAASSTSIVWQGLTNGSSYTFRVRAANGAPDPSEWSDYSESVTPAGPPTQVQNVSASRTDVGDSVQITVTWSRAQPNGDSIQGYVVTPYYNGQAQNPLSMTSADATSTVFDGPLNTGSNAGSYTFTVEAVNGVGNGQPSAQTAPIRDVTRPGTPTGVQGTDGNGDSTITFTAGAANGAQSGELSYQYRVRSGSGAWSAPAAISNGGSIALSNNGGPYQVQVRAVSVVDGVTYEGGWSEVSNQIRPYGAVGQISVTATALNESVRFDVQPPNRNGRDITLEYRINGTGGWQPLPSSNSVTQNGSANQQISIEVRATTGAAEAGHGAQTSTDSASARARPAASISLSHGDVYARGSCNGNGGSSDLCYFYQLHFDNLEPGTYRYECYNEESGNGNGNAFQSGQTTIGSWSGSTQAGTGSVNNHMCYSGFDGPAWIVLTGGPGNVNLETNHVSNW